MSQCTYAVISIEQIQSSRHQARKSFDEEKLKSLAESIKQEGLLEPIIVRQIGETESSPVQYELVSGERRLRACRLNGLATIEAKIIQPVSEAEAAAKGMVENLQREDLDPIEEAEGLANLSKLDPTYWTQAKIATVTGKSKSHVSETIRLLDLPDQIKDKFRRRNLSSEHGAELLRLSTPEDQAQAARQIEEKGLSRNETRSLVNTMLKRKKTHPKKSGRPRIDPLAETWPQLLADPSISACGYWSVEYKKGAWNFKVSDTKFTADEDFAEWFHQMGDALTKALVATRC